MNLFNDHLPKPRCTTDQREDYEKACELEGVNVTSNLRKLAVDWVAKVFKKHGKAARRIVGAGKE